MKILHSLLREPTARLLAVFAVFGGLAACDPDISPPFEIEGAGALEGRAYYDADANGLYDPAAGDEPLTGVTLLVRERGTDRTIAGAQATTDEQGRFRIENLPPGTHDVFVDPETLTQGVLCTNPIPTSIYRNETAFLGANAREACLVTIEDAKAEGVGEVVNVRGVVTMAPGQGRIQGEDMYIQDGSAGIKIFGSAMREHDLQIGDLVDVTATLGLFNDELQLTSPRFNDVVREVGAPEPALITTGHAATQGAPPTRPDLGRLVRVERAKLLTPFETGGGRNAIIDDGSGAVEIRIEPGVVEAVGDINPQFTVGACYDIVGVLGTFRGTPQLKPRSLNDVEEVACE